MTVERITYLNNGKEERILDEVLVVDVQSVHIERMDDGRFWIALNSNDKGRVVVNLFTRRGALINGHAESEPKKKEQL